MRPQLKKMIPRSLLLLAMLAALAASLPITPWDRPTCACVGGATGTSCFPHIRRGQCVSNGCTESGGSCVES